MAYCRRHLKSADIALYAVHSMRACGAEFAAPGRPPEKIGQDGQISDGEPEPTPEQATEAAQEASESPPADDRPAHRGRHGGGVGTDDDMTDNDPFVAYLREQWRAAGNDPQRRAGVIESAKTLLSDPPTDGEASPRARLEAALDNPDDAAV